MPRGVYDRTKTAEQRAAEKKSAAKAPKKAPAKKAAKAAKSVKAVPHKKAARATSVNKPQDSKSVGGSTLDPYAKFSIVRDNISALANAVHGLVSGKMSSGTYQSDEIVAELDSELKANIEILSSLRRDVFGLSAAEQRSTDDEPAKVTASVAPKAPSQPYPAQPQGTVPMPPAPIGQATAQ